MLLPPRTWFGPVVRVTSEDHPTPKWSDECTALLGRHVLPSLSPKAATTLAHERMHKAYKRTHGVRAQVKRRVNVVPVKEARDVTMTWPMPPVDKHYRSKPAG